MKIGIDLDGVVLDYEKEMFTVAEIYDLEKCRGKGKVHPNEFFVQDKYDWSDVEKEQFVQEDFYNISKNSPIMPGTKYVLDKLKGMGHDRILISARGTEGDKFIDVVEEKLKKENIEFDKYYWKQNAKLEICQKEKIDIMIDDKPETCKKLSENGIKTLYFRGIRGFDLKKSEYLIEVKNWGEVYRYIKGVNK